MTGSVKIYEKDDTKSVIENIDNCSIRVKEFDIEKGELVKND